MQEFSYAAFRVMLTFKFLFGKLQNAYFINQ